MKRVLFLLTIVFCLFSFKSVYALNINAPVITGVDYIDSSTIKLNYKANNSDDSYKVQIYNMTLGKFESDSVTSTSHTLSNLVTGKTYNFIMRVYYGTTVSNWSNIVSATPKAGIPVITSITTGDGELTLNYDTKDKPYQVEIYSSNLKDSIKTTDLNSYKVTGLTNGNLYTFMMRNCDSDSKCGSWSNALSGTPVKSATPVTPTSTIKKKVIIVIGASQVTRMKNHVSSYTTPNGVKYSKSAGTLKFIDKGGEGIPWQYGTGISKAKTYMKKFDKKTTKFFILYPLIGNSICKFTCSGISTTNSSILGYAKNYNSSIVSLKNSGYMVDGYVVSMHPVVPSEGGSKVVKNTSSKACNKGYRSNWKYYKFNLAMESIVKSKYSSDLIYIETFKDIMNVSDTRKDFSFKINYKTSDGVHWKDGTTDRYVNMMLNKVSGL